jgi:hypothetical protein
MSFDIHILYAVFGGRGKINCQSTRDIAELRRKIFVRRGNLTSKKDAEYPAQLSKYADVTHKN